MQAGADHARKYGGTGLGLAICKQLVELMGGHLTVTSQEHSGSTFTFLLPCKVPLKQEYDDDSDEAISNDEVLADASIEGNYGSFLFKPRTLGTLFSSDGSIVRKTKLFGNNMVNALNTPNRLPQVSAVFSSKQCTLEKKLSIKSISSTSDATDTLTELEGPQSNLEHDAYNTDTAKRRDGICEDETACYLTKKVNGFKRDSCISRSSTTLQESQKCTMKSTEIANVDDSGGSILTCQSHNHNKENVNSQRKSDGTSELSKIQLRPKILLVEDNKINVMVAQSMMKQLGYSIDVVNNGLEAIHAVQRSHFDLILMDVCMPVMDGLQATRLIRFFEEHGYWDESVGSGVDHAMPCSDSAPSGPDTGQCRNRIPIIAMTANALAESSAECLANGMDSFVSKPVTFQKLKQCLQQYLPC